MLKKYSQPLKCLLFASDICLFGLAWFTSLTFAYQLTLRACLSDPMQAAQYLRPLPLLIVSWALLVKYMDLYIARRGRRFVTESIDILKAIGVMVAGLVLFSFATKTADFSRTFILYFGLTAAVLLITGRLLLREGLRVARSRGYNTRNVLILGSGNVGQRIAHVFHERAWDGFKVVGYADDFIPAGTLVNGQRVLGTLDALSSIIQQSGVDQVFVALPFKAYERIGQIMKYLENEMVDVRLVPDIIHLSILKASVDNFEGMPLITLSEGPIYGLRAVMKRMFDIVFSLSVLVLLSPVLGAIALLIKLTSPGPVIYRQKRMGLDGEIFEILKFRTMHVNAENDIGPVWARKDDTRKTQLGAFLRRTSLDELPQFFNVLKGEMSVVGPRPERPEFIQNFRKEIPKYMLRHRVKAGITGWAQVNGWRGNTSLERRIDCDIFYLKNWTFLLDFKIIFFTLFRGFVNKNAY